MDKILKLKSLLKEKKMTYSEFSLAIGKSRPTVTNYFNGKSKIDIDTIEKISEVLGVPVGYFFKENNDYISKRLDFQNIIPSSGEKEKLETENEYLKKEIENLKDKLNDKDTIEEFYFNNTDMLVSSIAQLISDMEFILKQKNIDKKELHKTVGYKIYIKFWDFYNKSIIQAREKRKEMLLEKRINDI